MKTVVTELPPLLALDISGLTGGVNMDTSDNNEDSIAGRGGGGGGGQISPATTVAICMISSCASLVGTGPMSCSPVDSDNDDVEETRVSSAIIASMIITMLKIAAANTRIER